MKVTWKIVFKAIGQWTIEGLLFSLIVIPFWLMSYALIHIIFNYILGLQTLIFTYIILFSFINGWSSYHLCKAIKIGNMYRLWDDHDGTKK